MKASESRIREMKKLERTLNLLDPHESQVLHRLALVLRCEAQVQHWAGIL
jgi:hypothetical protein